MNSLDLSVAPPRAPRAQLAGVVFLPRSIDKMRALLPGGTLGAYTVPGFTQLLLDMLGLPLDALRDAVANAKSDADVATFVLENTTQMQRDEWNDFAAKRLPRGGDREAALLIYPWLSERSGLPLALDVLEEDDRRAFGLA